MDISFKRTKIQKIFNSESELRKEYGNEQARIIMRRMMVLSAAENLNDISCLPPERCHELTGNMQDHFAVDLKQPYRLIFIPDHESIPKKDDGGIDLKKVTAIQIIEIKDYHKK
jgi:plasmid maintenance system killer protein